MVICNTCNSNDITQTTVKYINEEELSGYEETVPEVSYFCNNCGKDAEVTNRVRLSTVGTGGLKVGSVITFHWKSTNPATITSIENDIIKVLFKDGTTGTFSKNVLYSKARVCLSV